MFYEILTDTFNAVRINTGDKSHRLNEVTKAFPLFFRLASNAFSDIGLIGRIEKKKKKSQEVSE